MLFDEAKKESLEGEKPLWIIIMKRTFTVDDYDDQTDIFYESMYQSDLAHWIVYNSRPALGIGNYIATDTEMNLDENHVVSVTNYENESSYARMTIEAHRLINK